jgi:hypothetical protein
MPTIPFPTGKSSDRMKCPHCGKSYTRRAGCIYKEGYFAEYEAVCIACGTLVYIWAYGNVEPVGGSDKDEPDVD